MISIFCAVSNAMLAKPPHPALRTQRHHRENPRLMTIARKAVVARGGVANLADPANALDSRSTLRNRPQSGIIEPRTIVHADARARSRSATGSVCRVEGYVRNHRRQRF